MHKKKQSVLVLFIISLFFCANSYAQSSFTIHTKKLDVEVSAAGRIISINTPGQKKIAITAETLLLGLYCKKIVMYEQLPDGSITLEKQMADSTGDRSCVMKELLKPAGNSVRWQVEITGSKYNWSTAIQTKIIYPVSKGSALWTAASVSEQWTDPLMPYPFDSLHLIYGSTKNLKYAKGFSLPLITILEKKDDIGISYVQSPEDTLIAMGLEVTKKGSIIFSRKNLRISPQSTVRFSADIILHESDWRPGVAWLKNRYPAYFVPPNNYTHQVAGPSSYSGYRGKLDEIFYKKIIYGFNWFASRSWPYLGMFLPPVADNEMWNSWTGFGSETTTKGSQTNFATINKDYKNIHQQGFHQLAYFNFTEFGYKSIFPAPEKKAATGADLWKDPNDYLHYKLNSAILYSKNHQAFLSWNQSVVMDPGTPVYENFLLEQLQRHLDKVPEIDGICVDRMDWFEKFNYRRDDGISWDEEMACASLITSWRSISDKVANLLHQNKKVFYCNPHLARLDLIKPVDGIFDENANNGGRLNLTAFLGIAKPVIGWIHGEEDFESSPDNIMQRHLYLGVYPMAPFPEANHSLKPSDSMNKLYSDYGLLFQALKQKEWVLLPHVITVNSSAKINIFKSESGYILPVVFGNDTLPVKINVLNKLLPGKKSDYVYEVIKPGEDKWTMIKAERDNSYTKFLSMLKRGCALIRIKHK